MVKLGWILIFALGCHTSRKSSSRSKALALEGPRVPSQILNQQIATINIQGLEKELIFIESNKALLAGSIPPNAQGQNRAASAQLRYRGASESLSTQALQWTSLSGKEWQDTRELHRFSLIQFAEFKGQKSLQPVVFSAMGEAFQQKTLYFIDKSNSALAFEVDYLGSSESFGPGERLESFGLLVSQNENLNTLGALAPGFDQDGALVGFASGEAQVASFQGQRKVYYPFISVVSGAAKTKLQFMNSALTRLGTP